MLRLFEEIRVKSGSRIRRGAKLLAAAGMLLGFAVPLAQADMNPSLLSTSSWNPEPWTMALFGCSLVFLSLLVRRVTSRSEK